MRPTGSRLLHRLATAAATLLPLPLCPPLRATQAELSRSLDLAFRLAAAHQRTVVLEPFRAAGEGRLSLRLPEGVRWGRPPAVPLPRSLSESGWGHEPPYPITVMPQRRAASNVWFLHHGRQALCLRLGLAGTVELLRYHPLLGTWSAC